MSLISIIKYRICKKKSITYCIIYLLFICIEMDPGLLDPRQYHYQYRRPRVNNPTFLSSNVGSTLIQYMNDPIYSNKQSPLLSRNSSGSINQANLIQKNQNNRYQKPPQQHEVIQNAMNIPNIKQNNNPPEGFQQHQSTQLKNPKGQQNLSVQQLNHGKIVSSNLSTYGSNLINTKPILYNEQEVYKKQQKKFNIINLRPKEYDQFIKQYPKLTLEDKDFYFQKRMQLQEQQQQHHETPKPAHKNFAGRQTYQNIEVHHPVANQVNQPGIKPRILTNMDELDNL